MKRIQFKELCKLPTLIPALITIALTLGSIPVYAESPSKPPDEIAMIAAVMLARDQYNNGGNDMTKGAARFARKQALCNLMSNAEVSDWIGKATSLTTNSDGKGVISVEIAEGISVKTWNNDISDIEDNTMLIPTSRVLSIYQFSRHPQSFGSGRHLRKSLMARRRPRVNQESFPRASLAG